MESDMSLDAVLYRKGRKGRKRRLSYGDHDNHSDNSDDDHEMQRQRVRPQRSMSDIHKLASRMSGVEFAARKMLSKRAGTRRFDQDKKTKRKKKGGIIGKIVGGAAHALHLDTAGRAGAKIAKAGVVYIDGIGRALGIHTVAHGTGNKGVQSIASGTGNVLKRSVTAPARGLHGVVRGVGVDRAVYNAAGVFSRALHRTYLDSVGRAGGEVIKGGAGYVNGIGRALGVHAVGHASYNVLGAAARRVGMTHGQHSQRGTSRGIVRESLVGQQVGGPRPSAIVRHSLVGGRVGGPRSSRSSPAYARRVRSESYHEAMLRRSLCDTHVNDLRSASRIKRDYHRTKSAQKDHHGDSFHTFELESGILFEDHNSEDEGYRERVQREYAEAYNREKQKKREKIERINSRQQDRSQRQYGDTGRGHKMRGVRTRRYEDGGDHYDAHYEDDGHYDDQHYDEGHYEDDGHYYDDHHEQEDERRSHANTKPKGGSKGKRKRGHKVKERSVTKHTSYADKTEEERSQSRAQRKKKKKKGASKGSSGKKKHKHKSKHNTKHKHKHYKHYEP